MAKIAFIGAGSVGLAKNLLGHQLRVPALADVQLALVDSDAERLRAADRMAHELAAALGTRPTITGSGRLLAGRHSSNSHRAVVTSDSP